MIAILMQFVGERLGREVLQRNARVHIAVSVPVFVCVFTS